MTAHVKSKCENDRHLSHLDGYPPQPVISKDNVEILVDGIMWVLPAADEEVIKRTFYNRRSDDILPVDDQKGEISC